MQIREGGLDHPQVIALLREHAEAMTAQSPEGMCHFLDLDALRGRDITFLSAWEEDALLGCGALKTLNEEAGEIKSMRTASSAQRRGVARDLLHHIEQLARAQGLRQLSLETGCGPAFEPALALYRANGFQEGDPFGDYEATAFNRYFHKALEN